MEKGCTSEVGTLKRVLLKHPRDAFISQENIASQWKELNFTECPDYDRALEEYEHLFSFLRESIPEILFLPRDERTGLDSIYVHDPAVITKRGAVLCSMGKQLRRGEPEAMGDFLKLSNIPVLGAITGTGRLEGGDVVLFDETTLAVGRGSRTNEQGIQQLKELTSDFIREFRVVPLPPARSSKDVLHLMSLISPVDHDLAVVYSKLLPSHFQQWLLKRGLDLIEVPDEEYETMACNVLAVAPRRCIMLAGNPRTRQMLIERGVDVLEYRGEEISRKGSGGPTCLTRPLLRKS